MSIADQLIKKPKTRILDTMTAIVIATTMIAVAMTAVAKTAVARITVATTMDAMIVDTITMIVKMTVTNKTIKTLMKVEPKTSQSLTFPMKQLAKRKLPFLALKAILLTKMLALASLI